MGGCSQEIKSSRISRTQFRIGGMAGLVLPSSASCRNWIGAPDIYPALEKGTIDAAGMGRSLRRREARLNKVDNITITGFWRAARCDDARQRKKWSELPKPYQAALMAVRRSQRVDAGEVRRLERRQALRGCRERQSFGPSRDR